MAERHMTKRNYYDPDAKLHVCLYPGFAHHIKLCYRALQMITAVVVEEVEVAEVDTVEGEGDMAVAGAMLGAEVVAGAALLADQETGLALAAVITALLASMAMC